MGRIKTRLPKLGTLILLWIGGVILLGVVGWGIGWTAHRVFDARGTSTPTRTVRPAATHTPEPVATVVPTGVPAVAPTVPGSTDVPPTSTVASPDGTVQPAATLVPRPTLVEEENEVVQVGDGLLKVCRRHCPERWPPDDDALTSYAEEVAQMNGLPWPNPSLSPGQILKMPPCPER